MFHLMELFKLGLDLSFYGVHGLLEWGGGFLVDVGYLVEVGEELGLFVLVMVGEGFIELVPFSLEEVKSVVRRREGDERLIEGWGLLHLNKNELISL